MKRFNEIIHYEPLTLNQIEKLSTHFNKYIQPGNQTKSGKHALVCYTTADREGAITEAETMIDSLQVTLSFNLMLSDQDNLIPKLLSYGSKIKTHQRSYH